MEEPVHSLMLLLLPFNGILVKEIIELTNPMTLWECLQYADEHRETISHYVFERDGKNINTWFLNNGSGTYQGSICFQDPDRIE